jgi:hypothetical protein
MARAVTNVKATISLGWRRLLYSADLEKFTHPAFL